MDVDRLIEALSQQAAYPGPVDEITVRQTHISVVFLAGGHVYKLKKPVQFGFLDFGTLAKRRHFCEEEVRLNRRLAAEVYEGVVPVARDGDTLRWEGRGEVVEWGVKMRRLPDEARLGERLRHGEATRKHLTELARLVADFHRRASAGPDIAAYGRFPVVAANARENFVQSQRQIGITVSHTVFRRLREETEARLGQLRERIEARANRGMTRETHGDLHLEHVYFFPHEASPRRWLVIDCIEFNEKFRHADPVADLAFLLMDLRFRGHRREADWVEEAYLDASGDIDGRDLLPFYVAYRAAVRGKVEGFELNEHEIPAEEKVAAQAHSRAHWLLAYATLLAGKGPALILVGGLPGTGKTTLAQALARTFHCPLIRTDVVRKELAGLETAAAPTNFGEGIYTAAMTERTYSECLRRAEAALFEGNRVIVDGNFRTERHRHLFLDAARRWALPPLLLWCEAPPEVVRARLAARYGDASDADWAIYTQAADRLEPFDNVTREAVHTVPTSPPLEAVFRTVFEILRAAQLVQNPLPPVPS